MLNFYTPVFRRDILWYGDVRPGLRPSDSPSVRLSVCPTLRSVSVGPTLPSVSVRLILRPDLRPPVFHTFLLHALTY